MLIHVVTTSFACVVVTWQNYIKDVFDHAPVTLLIHIAAVWLGTVFATWLHTVHTTWKKGTTKRSCYANKSHFHHTASSNVHPRLEFKLKEFRYNTRNASATLLELPLMGTH